MPIKADWKPHGEAPVDEISMIEMIFNQAILPQELARIQQVSVSSPMKHNEKGELVRPSAGDTILAWLALKPEAGNCLVISNQPHCGYIDAVMRTFLPATLSVETVGEFIGDVSNGNIAIILDSLTRRLYQEQICLRRLP